MLGGSGSCRKNPSPVPQHVLVELLVQGVEGFRWHFRRLRGPAIYASGVVDIYSVPAATKESVRSAPRPSRGRSCAPSQDDDCFCREGERDRFRDFMADELADAVVPAALASGDSSFPPPPALALLTRNLSLSAFPSSPSWLLKKDSAISCASSDIVGGMLPRLTATSGQTRVSPSEVLCISRESHACPSRGEDSIPRPMSPADLRIDTVITHHVLMNGLSTFGLPPRASRNADPRKSWESRGRFILLLATARECASSSRPCRSQPHQLALGRKSRTISLKA